MLETTIAGSLPKPAWLAEPEKLWPAWRQDGADLDRVRSVARAQLVGIAMRKHHDVAR